MIEIKPGDLVMVIKPKPCCGGGSLGYTFTVANAPFRNTSTCMQCGLITPEDALVATDEGNNYVVLVSRLKKIDPSAEGDSLPTRRELTVKA